MLHHVLCRGAPVDPRLCSYPGPTPAFLSPNPLPPPPAPLRVVPSNSLPPSLASPLTLWITMPVPLRGDSMVARFCRVRMRSSLSMTRTQGWSRTYSANSASHSVLCGIVDVPYLRWSCVCMGNRQQEQQQGAAAGGGGGRAQCSKVRRSAVRPDKHTGAGVSSSCCWVQGAHMPGGAANRYLDVCSQVLQLLLLKKGHCC